MYRYIIQRILLAIPTLVGAAVIVFVLMRLIPGDICVVRLGSGGGTFDERAVAACHAELGLDRPLWLQFFDFVWGFCRFDFGTSMWSGKPVSYEIMTRLPISLEIALLATVVALTIAIPLGTISALKQNSWIDLVVRTVAIAGIATPVVLDRHPVDPRSCSTSPRRVFGAPWMPPIDYVPIWQDPIRNLSMAILPAITVGYRYSAVTMRMTRSAMLEVLREDYIRTARAKGLIERIIINRHALKNALLPVVTLIGIEFAFLIGGLVVTEQVFNLNGVGRLLVLAVQNQDYTLDPGIGDAGRRRLRPGQSGRRSRLCVARSAHPLRLTEARAMSSTAIRSRLRAADELQELKHSIRDRVTLVSAAASRSARSAWRSSS